MQSNFRSVIIGLIFITILFTILSSPDVYGQEKEQAGTDGIWIGGKVIWPGHDLTKASVKVYKDPQFEELYTEGLLLRPEGVYTLSIEHVGTYYIVAFVDNNGSNRFDAGDGMGMYGITDWADPDQKPKPIRLESGMKLPGIDIQITAVVDDQGRMKPISASESGVGTGIAGKLIWLNPPSLEKEDEGEFSNAILFVYSDPSWNNRITQTKVGETGEYEVSVPAGRYYLLAIIDENNTNLLDVGDKFGIWGMTKFGMFPKAVEVNAGNITESRNILIIGQMSISGKSLPLDAEASPASAQNDKTAILEDKISLSGNVVWPGHSLKFGMVQAYSDPSMTMVAALAKTDEKGRFRIAVPAGDYYIVAGVDADGDEKYTAGDGIGAYGAANAADQMPKKLTVVADPKNEEINLVITAEFDDSGQLKPISPYSILTPSPPRFLASSAPPSIQYAGISGKIVWEGAEISKATLIFSNEPRFESGIRTPLQLSEDGSYNCLTPPGDYYVMATMDRDENDEVGTGDGVGFYGAGYWGTPQKVTVLEGGITPFININVTALFGPDGELLPIQTPGSVRFRYGEPDDVLSEHTADRATQEWWYWDRGIVFTFEKTDAGWNLIDTSDFTPMEPDTSEKTPSSSQAAKENSNGMLYYTFDRSIWAMDADGTNRRWIAPGTRPTTTSDGSKLLFLDTSGNIYLAEPENDAPAQLVLNRRKAGLQPAISHSGKVVAFTRSSGDYRQMILKNLETGAESAIPAGTMELYHPAWSPDDELIAYSAAPPSSSDQRDRNRDIYYYDIAAGRTDRVSTSPLDEFDPAWSPGNKRALVYCRAEGDHAQLWIVNFDTDGKPIEQQLTKLGGRNPAWSPEGDKITYENNAQLWTIKPDGSDGGPILVDDEPVFGMDPFWTR